MRRLWHETRELTREAFRVMRDYRLRIAIGFAVVCAIAIVTVPHDTAWTDALRAGHTERSLAIADFFSDWGDYPRGTFLMFGVLLTLGYLLDRPLLRRAALAVLLAASMSGLVVITLRTLVGRPRPRSDRPDGIYGPSFDYELNSFPSGHTASAYATAFALVPTLPWVGVPALLFATGTAWSRMHSYHHHPTDVMVAGAFGALFGLAFGGAVKRRNRAPDG